jgi:hypothetical protein
MKWRSILDWVINIIGIVLMILVYDTWAGKGLLVVFVGLSILVLWQCWRGRELILNLLRKTETVIYGKPLEQKFWKEGEWKNTKVKMVLKK